MFCLFRYGAAMWTFSLLKAWPYFESSEHVSFIAHRADHNVVHWIQKEVHRYDAGVVDSDSYSVKAVTHVRKDSKTCSKIN
jgi:hypothetical protein